MEAATKRRIVLGFDGSDESRDAARLAKSLAELEAAEVVVVASFDYAPLPVTVVEHERSFFEAAQRVFAEASQHLEGIPTSTRAVAASSPARALNDVAREVDAAMIVLGSTHRGSLGHVFPGSVGERLLHGAPCAVAVAPRGFATREHFGRGIIGAGYDGSVESRLAVREAARIARRVGGQLRVIRVMHPFQPSGGLAGYIPRVRGEFQTDLEEQVRAVREEPSEPAAAVEVKGVFLEGDPAVMLSEQGVELELLVVGSRGYGPLLRTLLGGVSAEVIRTAPCPVLVVSRGIEETEDGGARRELAPEEGSR